MRYILGTLVVLGIGTGVGLAEPLITETEAALPSPPDVAMSLRGITRGPAIEQVQPEEMKPVKSPTLIKIKFTARNNAEIDKDSLKVTYVKSPSVDLTSRLKAHVKSEGIEMSGAELPPGIHVLRIDVKDTQGRSSTGLVKIAVTK